MSHEERFHNTVVKTDLLQRWIALSKQFEKPLPSVVPVVEFTHDER